MLTEYVETIQKLAAEECERINRKWGYAVADADDVVQETYLTILENGEDPSTKDNPGAWLRSVIRNKTLQAVDGRTHYGREVQADLRVPEEYDEGGEGESLGAYLVKSNPANDDPEAETIGADTLGTAEAMLHGCLSLLVGRERKVAEAYYLDGLDAKDIAGLLGVSHQVVKHIMSAAKRRLGPSEADLRAWRTAMFPEARKPRGEGGEALILAGLVA